MSAGMTREERSAALDRISRTAKTTVTYLRKSSNLLHAWRGAERTVPTDYWSLLDAALETAFDIVEVLPDHFFETTEHASIFDGQPFKHNLSDDPREAAQKVLDALEQRRKKASKMSVIERLEAVEGRTPEEAALYLEKARELREAL